MDVYLIRHADAIDGDEDSERPLSKHGQEQVQALAAFLRRTSVFQPEVIWHSSLVRARQTAELLAQRMKLTAPRTVMPDLEPDADPRAIFRRIKATRTAVAIVGHEPHLSALATLLVVGKTEPAAFAMKKCSVLALDGIGTRWTVRWHVSPQLIG
jgi:phosphohistidine phosphatase